MNISILREIEDAEIAEFVPQDSQDNIIKSYRCYRHFERCSYDIIHFHDYLGVGFYTAMARRQGLLASAIITQTHGSSEWVRRYNLGLPDLGNLETEALERSQIELSDLVVSPSRYMLDWYRDNGVNLPKQTEVINWVLPGWLAADAEGEPSRTRALPPNGVREIIFFGRHERRKGIEVFVEAVRLMKHRRSCDITFLGRFDRIDCENSVGYILRQLQDFPGRLQFLNDYSQSQALQYIRSRPHALCVMPSLIENSPCTVGEVFSIAAPFIASNVGGTSELISPADQEDALFVANPVALARRLDEVRCLGLRPLLSVLSPAPIMAAWQSVHEKLNAGKPRSGRVPSRPRPGKGGPLVSVCLVHHDRPRLLLRALDHLLQQTYQNMEIVIVDDGSQSMAAGKVLDDLEARYGCDRFRIVRSANRYLGAARNLAASIARGDYLVFHDDDNVATPDQIALFMQAAETGGFEILTAQSFVFKDGDHPETGKIEYFPIGIGGPHAFFANRFGDANALITRSAFERVGGFSELYGVGWEDWEFFLKAYLRGIRIGIVPRPLFYYFSSPDGMLASGSPVRNNARIFDALREAKPALAVDLIQLARRSEVAQQVLDHTWNALGREPLGYLHRELMPLEPNSDESMTKIVDLAFSLGRIEDAVELGLHVSSTRDQLYRLLTASGSLGERKTRLVADSCTILPDYGRAYEIEGWAATTKLSPLRICSVRINDQRYRIEGYEATARGDVAASFGQSGHPLVGFTLTVVEDTGAVTDDGEATTELTIRCEGNGASDLQGPMAITVEGNHSVQAMNGWIERAVPLCRRLVRMPETNDHNFTGRMEFVLDPRPEEGGYVICKSKTSPLIDLGGSRFEAFTTGIRLRSVATDDRDPVLLALYSPSDLEIVEAMAYRWNSYNVPAGGQAGVQ